MLAIEQFTFDNFTGVRDTDLQFISGLAKLASTRSGKEEDFLAGEIIAFQEGVNDGWCNIPPNGETQEDGVILINPCILIVDGGTNGLIIYLNGTA